MAIPDLSSIPIRRTEMPVPQHPIVFLHTGPLTDTFVAKPEQWGAHGHTPAVAKRVFAKSLEFMGSLFEATTSQFPEMRSLTDREVERVRSLVADEEQRRMLPVDGHTWLVMSFVHNLKDLEGLARKRDSTATSVMAYLSKTPKVMRELGRIFVVDLFNGSGDRFFVGPRPNEAGVQNLGNLFVVSPHKLFMTFEFSGIDFWDPSSDVRDLYQPVAPELGLAWSGVFLKDAAKGQLETFAKKIVEHIPVKMTKAAANADAQRKPASDDDDDEPPGPLTVKLAPAHTKEFVVGIKEGKSALKAHLQKRAKTTGVPSGVMSRMRLLGW